MKTLTRILLLTLLWIAFPQAGMADDRISVFVGILPQK